MVKDLWDILSLILQQGVFDMLKFKLGIVKLVHA